MPELQEEALKAQLKSEDFARVYLLYGSQGYLKQHYAALIPKKCVTPGMEGFNFKKMEYSDGATLAAVLDAAEVLPAFGGKMCIVARDFPLDALGADDQSRLEAFLKDPPESAVVVFWQDTTVVEPRKNAKWRSVIAQIGKAGATVSLDTPNRQTLLRLLTTGAQKRGCTLGKAEAEFLTETVGDDLSLLLGELEKLCNYKQGGEITRADIEAVATKSLEANVFDLSKSLVAGNCARALALLGKLLSDKERPEMLLGTLIGAYVDMYRVKLAMESGESAQYPAELFNYKGKEFRLRNAARDAGKMGVQELRTCLDLLHEADTALKWGVQDPKTVLERLLVQLSQVKAGR